MRKFSSYGPPNAKLHYFAPRERLIEKVRSRLLGDRPEEGGLFITVWGLRQTGKTWVVQQVLHRLRSSPDNAKYDAVKVNLQNLKAKKNIG